MLSVNQEMASQAQDENRLFVENRRRDSEGDDSEEDQNNLGSDSEVEDEKAYTLAVIVNVDQTFGDVSDFWRLHTESMQKICQNQTAQDRPPTNRIIMDEIPRKTHDHCPGFNFSSIDEITGRNHTSSIGASNTTDFRAQQS